MEGFDWLSLDDGENIQWKGQPRMKSIVPALIVGIPTSIVGIGILIILGAYFSVKNTYYVVTTNGLYRKKGILSRDVQKIGFDKIQNISFSQGIFGNYFGYGNIEISTAGGERVEMRFRSIEKPREVQDTINKHIKQEKDKSSGPEESDTTKEILEELRKTRKAVERIEDNMN